MFLQDFLKYKLVEKAFKGISCAVAVIILFAGIKLFKNFKKTALSIFVFTVTIILMVLSEIGLIRFNYLTVCIILFGGLIGILTFINDNRKNKKALLNDNKEENV